jgi:hypothetical protein
MSRRTDKCAKSNNNPLFHLMAVEGNLNSKTQIHEHSQNSWTMTEKKSLYLVAHGNTWKWNNG